MFDQFHDMAELEARIIADKEFQGIGASTLDRFPIRFVLLDNFRDCFSLVDFLQTFRDVQVESVDRWMDSQYPDLMLTHIELAEKLEAYIKQIGAEDCVIAPFSELARFYNNEFPNAVFDSLIKTIKGIQATPAGVEKHQRIYIPIVGLEGKMEKFNKDSQITVWRLVSEEKDLTYRLILTDGKDFGVKGLSSKYTIVNSIQEWLNIWKDTRKQVSPNIVCKSSAIYANARYAQPDNAFSYAICDTAYQFLVDGLRLNLCNLQPLSSDGDNWNLLAETIDIQDGFNLQRFVRNYFGVDEIEDYKDFIRLWFMHGAAFDRWLLARYYMLQKGELDYLSKVLQATTNYVGNTFIETMVTCVNEDPVEMDVRKYCLQFAAKQHIYLTEAAESAISKLLQDLANSYGHTGALRYFTGVSKKERELALRWYGQSLITTADLMEFYPDLYYYSKEGIGVPSVPGWLEEYMAKYKWAKISNTYTSDIASAINCINASEAAFDQWYNQFSTTYTEMHTRGDVEVYFWVDGLGVEWIPLIKRILAERKEQGIFLNEVKIARALLPSKTDVNKQDLQRLLPEGVPLEKSGDLDALAHKTNNICPFTLMTEIDMVRKIMDEILNKYIGKKIAIISDHGLSYLPQLLQGKNMGGVESDHHGRVAIRKQKSHAPDSSYFRLDDEKTLCALKHESLCAKVPANQGIHGGCTPEEVLVPIFVISSAPAATDWSASIVDPDISGANPRVKFTIKNLPSVEKPHVIYNGVEYALHCVDGTIFESDALVLDNKETTIMLEIGSVMRSFQLKITTGVDTTDLFDF